MTIVRRNRIDRFLQLMVERGASDLHFSVSRPPMFRLNGEIDPLRYRVISNEDYVAMMQPIVPPQRLRAPSRTDLPHTRG